MQTVTISTHNGSTAHRDHNIRNAKVVSKEEHINPQGKFEIWADENPRHAYHRLFDEAVDRYNAHQTRDDRKIKNYYNDVNKDAKKHTVYEMIVGVYPTNNEYIDEQVQRDILSEFVKGWKKRNPNLELIGAYYHADEQGEPHVHIDYVPVAHGYVKGLDTQSGLVRALGEQGFFKEGRATAQILWEKRENEHLESLCKARELVVAHPIKSEREHLDTKVYKATRQLDESINHINELSTSIEQLKDHIGILEHQAQKSLERANKDFRKSFKKSKYPEGFTYNEGLKNVIQQTIKERSEDVKLLTHTNLDVEREYQKALTIKEQAEGLQKQAINDIRTAELMQRNELTLVREQAQQLFNEFIKTEFHAELRGKHKRLEEFCKNIKLADGTRVIDSFYERERKYQQTVEHDWDRSR